MNRPVKAWIPRHMSPAAIMLLIHCHCICTPIQDSPVNKENLEWFLRDGIIELADEDSDHESGYTTTEKGKMWLQMMEDTPMPVTKLVDPRIKETK